MFAPQIYLVPRYVSTLRRLQRDYRFFSLRGFFPPRRQRHPPRASRDGRATTPSTSLVRVYYRILLASFSSTTAHASRCTCRSLAQIVRFFPPRKARVPPPHALQFQLRTLPERPLRRLAAQPLAVAQPEFAADHEIVAQRALDDQGRSRLDRRVD